MNTLKIKNKLRKDLFTLRNKFTTLTKNIRNNEYFIAFKKESFGDKCLIVPIIGGGFGAILGFFGSLILPANSDGAIIHRSDPHYVS